MVLTEGHAPDQVQCSVGSQSITVEMATRWLIFQMFFEASDLTPMDAWDQKIKKNHEFELLPWSGSLAVLCSSGY